MEEIICQFKGWVCVYVYDKKSEYSIVDILHTYLSSEEKSTRLIEKLYSYPEKYVFLICPKKTKPKFNKKKVLSDTSSDLCLIHENSYLFINDFNNFNIAVLNDSTCVVVYRQGLDKTDQSTEILSAYHYLIPVIGVIILLYFIERKIIRSDSLK